MSYNTYRLNYLCTSGNNRTYGKTLYVFGGSSQNYSSPSSSTTTATQGQKESKSDKEASERRLHQLEKVHSECLQEKDETIASLRGVLVEHERRVLELEGGVNGNIIAGQGPAVDKEQPSSVQKLLDQIERLQTEKNKLLRKISDFEAKEAGLNSLTQETHDDDLSEQSELPYQLELCTTDTEKELANIKRVKHSLDLEIRKLRQENIQLRDRLTGLGVDTSDLIVATNKTSSEKPVGQSSGIGSNGFTESSEHSNGVSNVILQNQIQCLQQQIENQTAELNEFKMDEKRKQKLQDLLSSVQHTVGFVFREFLEVKNAYLTLRDDVKSAPLSLGEYMKNIQDQVQESLTDINVKYTEVIDKYLREMKLRKKYHNELVELRGNIRVLCRVRPLIKEDNTEDDTFVVSLDPADDTLIKVNNKGRIQSFDVDKAFGTTSTQEQVFDEVSSLVRSVIDGYNVCIFAYGQTGSGKTYTMEGPKSNPGINQRALQLLFNETVDDDWRYEISASVLEIYNEVIRDLLNPDQDCKLEVKMKPEGGLHVPGLISMPVSDLAMVNQIFETGRHNRVTASTNMNEHSSRSHCLLCVTVTGYNSTTGSKSHGRLNLVDLAGSERVSKSMVDGVHLKEAQNINKSLSCLGDVIHALRNKQSHVPYRNSKLTYLLQDSLGGDSKTLMIVQVAPVDKNVSETACTLAFGQRVRSVALGAASKNIDKTKSASAKRPSSLNTSSLSISISSPSLTSSPTSNQSLVSPSLNLSHSPSAPNFSSVTPSLTSPSFNGRRRPLYSPTASLKSPSPSPTTHRKLIFNSKPPSPLLPGQRRTVYSPQASLKSPSSPTPKKWLINSKPPTPTARKLPKTPEIITSPVTSKLQHFSKSSAAIARDSYTMSSSLLESRPLEQEVNEMYDQTFLNVSPC